MYTHSDQGIPLFEGKWGTTTAVHSFDPVLLTIPRDAAWYVRYTNGATSAVVIGDTLTGGTSNATIKLKHKVVDGGTEGSGDYGFLICDNSKSGPFQSETLTGTSTGTVDIVQDFMPVNFAGMSARGAQIWVETASIIFTLDGTTPTATAGTNHGTLLPASSSYVIEGEHVRNFKCINAVNASGAIVKYRILY